MLRYKLTIAYDGTNFSGWQIQPNARTVEETIEKAFIEVLQQPVDIVGQGRTDAGVHARGQVAHVDLPGEIDIDKTIFGVNSLTGDEVKIIQIERVRADFHARFDAISREYSYRIAIKPSPLLRHISWHVQHPLDFTKLEECAALLKGEFDFSAFAKSGSEPFTTLCTISANVFERKNDFILYRITANRFLRNMVRRLVGTMVRVAEGKLEVKEFQQMLQNPETDSPTFTAPAQGLVLEKVLYKID